MTPSGRAAALSHWQQLVSEFDRYHRAVSYIPTKELRLQEDLRRYLCLRCAGFLEQVTYDVLDDYLRRKSGSPVREFATSYFSRAPNLTPDGFMRLIARFGEKHEKSLADFLDEADRRFALGDLLGVRNEIAHGRYQPGRRDDPSRYRNLCEDIYRFLVDRYLGNAVDVMSADGNAVIGTASTPE